MGSYNTACFASHQTIASDDACRIIPILQQSSYQPVAISRADESLKAWGITMSVCNADSFWRPLGGFIPAKYDDRGAVKLQYSPLVRATVCGFISEMLTYGWASAAGENSRHDPAFDLPVFMKERAPRLYAFLTERTPVEGKNGELDDELTACWDYISDIANDHRVFRANNHYGPRPLQFAILHEHAYQALVALTTNGKDWNGDSMDPAAYLQRALDKGREDIKESSADMAGLEDHYAGSLMSSALRESLSRAAGDSSGLSPSLSNLITQISRDLVKGTLTDEAFIEKVRPMLLDRYAIAGLNSLNLRFSPQVYADQDYSNAIGRAYSRFVSDVSHQVTRTRHEGTYGPFTRYVATAADADDVMMLPTALNNYDAVIEDVASSLVDGELRVTFGCTLEMARLRELLAKEGFEHLSATLSRPDESSAQ